MAATSSIARSVRAVRRRRARAPNLSGRAGGGRQEDPSVKGRCGPTRLFGSAAYVRAGERRDLPDLTFDLLEDCLPRLPIREQKLLHHLGEVEQRRQHEALARQTVRMAWEESASSAADPLLFSFSRLSERRSIRSLISPVSGPPLLSRSALLTDSVPSPSLCRSRPP